MAFQCHFANRMAAKCQVTCACGAAFEVKSPRDQLILSKNKFARITALSNHRQSGTVIVDKPGYMFKIGFDESFDIICQVFFFSRPAGYF
jgi:hypothetical protein